PTVAHPSPAPLLSYRGGARACQPGPGENRDEGRTPPGPRAWRGRGVRTGHAPRSARVERASAAVGAVGAVAGGRAGQDLLGALGVRHVKDAEAPALTGAG